MHRLTIVGTGMGDGETLTRQAERAIEEAEFLIGGRRLLAPYPDKPHLVLDRNLDQAVAYIADHAGNQRICVLMSGDTGFYSYASYLLSRLPQAVEADLVCGVSSLQYLCSRFHMCYENMAAVSMHGRRGALLSTVSANLHTFVLTGGGFRAQDVCRLLWERGGGGLTVYIGERLGAADQRLLSGTADELRRLSFDDLTVLVVENPLAGRAYPSGEGLCPPLLEEDRCADLTGGDMVLEMAARVRGEALCLTEKPEKVAERCRAWGRYNIEPVSREALPRPLDAVYAGEDQAELLLELLEANPRMRFTLTGWDRERCRDLARELEDRGISFRCFRRSRLNRELQEEDGLYIFCGGGIPQ